MGREGEQEGGERRRVERGRGRGEREMERGEWEWEEGDKEGEDTVGIRGQFMFGF